MNCWIGASNQLFSTEREPHVVICYEVKRSQRHLLAAIENSRLGGPIQDWEEKSWLFLISEMTFFYLFTTVGRGAEAGGRRKNSPRPPLHASIWCNRGEKRKGVCVVTQIQIGAEFFQGSSNNRETFLYFLFRSTLNRDKISLDTFNEED